MEIEKLKDMLRNAAGGPVGIQMCQEAADALEQLQAENERLRRERDSAVKEIPKVCYYCKHRKGWKTCDRFNGNSEAETCTNWQWCGQRRNEHGTVDQKG